jgi:hypothetical protein
MSILSILFVLSILHVRTLNPSVLKHCKEAAAAACSYQNEPADLGA